MIICENGVRIVENVSELPLHLPSNLFLDFETTSGDPKKDSLNPWHNCTIAGICITHDSHPDAYYIPIGHHVGNNIDREAVKYWLSDTLKHSLRWINHNVKYDVHALRNDLGLEFDGEIIDTVTLSKVIDSDRLYKGGYGLKALSGAWLKDDISAYEEKLKPYLKNNKDYGAIPIDILGAYGGQDVLTNRRLWKFLQGECDPQYKNVWDTEIKLTSCLVDIEKVGLRVDPQELKIKQYKVLTKLLNIEEKLHELTGESFRPHTNADCYNILCNKYGLPILGTTDKGDPSFDKHALRFYLLHPYAPKDVVALILEYRELNTLNNIFLKPFQDQQIDGILHSSYNQSVRTGRLSCKTPNAQQFNDEAKKLIHPHEGYTFFSFDYSQIEFRLIVHYINDYAAIEAYKNDPNTDFHVWVAEMCSIPREPAKNVNFAIGYGGGKQKILSMLASDMSLMESLSNEIGDVPNREAVFNALCFKKAESVFDEWHATLPGLRRASRAASGKILHRGYVYNAYGRHLKMPNEVAYRAFNSIIQSSAADLLKERTVATAPRFNLFLKENGIRQVASVHDDTVFEIPTEICDDPRFVEHIIETLESPKITFRVPIIVTPKKSPVSWAAMETL